MSEIDDLMVDVMMRGDDEATNAIIRLIQLSEAGEIPAKQNRQVLKAIERRMEKVKSGSELHDFLLRLIGLIDADAKPKTSELPPEMESPDAVLARKMRGDNTPADYETAEPEDSKLHPVDHPVRKQPSGMDSDDLANFVHPKHPQSNNKPNKDVSDYYHPDKKDD